MFLNSASIVESGELLISHFLNLFISSSFWTNNYFCIKNTFPQFSKWCKLQMYLVLVISLIWSYKNNENLILFLFFQPSSCSSRSAVSSTCLSDFVTTVGKRLTHIIIANNKMSGLPFVFKSLSVSSNWSECEPKPIYNWTFFRQRIILVFIWLRFVHFIKGFSFLLQMFRYFFKSWEMKSHLVYVLFQVI